jgi:hypothetical protein
MTYSILARDPETGAFGVGGRSHAFAVGPVVGWLEPGLGGVATYERMNGATAAPGLLLGEFEDVPERSVETALAALDEAQQAVGADVEPSFWKGVMLVRAGRTEEARSLVTELYAAETKLRGLVQGLGLVGFLDASAVIAL